MTDRDLRALKTCARLLVDQLGGVDAASAALHYPASRLSEAVSPHHMDRWPRLDHVARLESLAAEPLVSAQLARLAGHALVPRAGAAADQPADALVRTLRACGELVGEAAAALRDGQICATERAVLMDQVEAALRALTAAQVALAGPPRPAVIRGAA